MSELYDFSKVKEYKLYTVLTPLAKAAAPLCIRGASPRDLPSRLKIAVHCRI